MIRVLTWFALALLLLGVAALPTQADPVVGQLYDGYFTFGHDGLFHYQDAVYSRQWVSSPGYWSYGVYYPGSAYWKYTRIANSYAAAAAPAYGTGWKSEVLRYAQARDDQQLYFESLKALGINGQSYGFQQYGAGYSAYSSPIGYTPQGATQYGYSVQQAREVYGYNLDLNKLAQISGQLTQGAQAAASQANTETNTVVTELGKNAARVAEVLARGQAAAEALRAARAQPSTSSTTTITGTGAAASVGGSGVGQIPAAPAAPATGGGSEMSQAEFLASVVTPACAGCHGGAKPQADFDIVKAWPGLTPQQKAVVYERLFTRDPEKHMPRTSDGKSGTLTQDQLKAFVSH